MSAPAGKHTLSQPLVKRFRSPEGEEREEQITEVTVRRPLAGDMRVTDPHEGDVAKGLALAARLTGLDVADVDRLELADFVAISEIVAGFMPPGLRTGLTSSAG